MFNRQSGPFMDLREIDYWCDRFEERIRQGDPLPFDRFLAENGLPNDLQLLAELRKVASDFPSPLPETEHIDSAEGRRGVATDDELDVEPEIGPYRLIRPLGEGGMGRVYLAEQTSPVARRVALKLIKPGMDSREVVRRFETERQTLARMEHPHIARVLDAGTTRLGRPFFVMELVEGLPITTYCDEQRLSIDERAELLLTVCQAVQHAHQKGVLHRDLKPTNVLVSTVDGRPLPKVIDFGLAKALDDSNRQHSLFTQYGQIVGTLAYMSPEQASAKQEDIDTQTDVYSLGVLLYELVTGVTPYDKRQFLSLGYEAMLKAIREQEPPCPSTRLSGIENLPEIAARRGLDASRLTSAVRGELDWIVMKALEKEPFRRYESALDLSRDLQRYLSNEPVLAGPPSTNYRLRKFVARNKAVVVSGAIVMLAILAGMAGTTWQAIRATLAEGDLTVQRDLARRKEREALTSLGRAEKAEGELNDALRAALLGQAQARRLSGRQGQRFESLAAIREAATGHPTLELRNEAIACLALPDFGVEREWDGCPDESITAIAFDQTLEQYARGDRMGNVSLRTVADDREIAVLPGNGAACSGLLISPDGRHLVTICLGDGSVFNHAELWNIDVHPPTSVFKRPVIQHCLDFHPAADEIAIAESNDILRIYRTSDGELLRELPSGFPYSLGFDSTGRRLAIADQANRRIDVADSVTGARLCRIGLTGDEVLGMLTWHPYGNRLAFGIGNRIAIANVGSQMIESWLEGHPEGRVASIAYNHAGSVLVSSSDQGRVNFWDGVNETLMMSTMNAFHRGRCAPYQFSKDDSRLAAHLVDGRLQIWKVSAHDGFREIRCQGFPSATYHPRKPIAAFVDKGRLCVWDLSVGRTLCTVPLKEYRTARFHPQGTGLVAANSAGLQFFPISLDDSGLPERMSIDSPRTLWAAPFIQQFDFSSSGKRLAVIRGGGVPTIFSGESFKQLLTLEDIPDPASLAVHADGKSLATTSFSSDGVEIRDMETGQRLLRFPEVERSAQVTCGLNRRWLMTGEANGCRLWDLKTQECVLDIPAEDTNGAVPIAISPDGAMAAMGARNGAIRLVSLPEGRELATLNPPIVRALKEISFSPDGTRIAVSAGDALQLWNLRVIRAQLRESGLDWDAPEYLPGDDAASVRPILFESGIPTEHFSDGSTASLDHDPVTDEELIRRLGSLTQTPLMFGSMRSGEMDLYLADPVSTKLRNLTADGGADSGPAWSPDGTRIAFESTRVGKYAIFVMNPDGGDVRQITQPIHEDRMPVWSPDGQRICFRRAVHKNPLNWDLMVMDADGTNVRSLTDGLDKDSDPSWSMSNRLAFGSNRPDDRWTVFSINPDGTHLRQVRTFTSGWYPHPCWSPDGLRVAFTAVYFNEREIHVMNADGTEQRRLTNLKGLNILASWSPDGRHIAFVHRPSGSSESNASLCVMNADGSNLTVIGPMETTINCGRPAWKPLVKASGETADTTAP